MEVLKPRSPRRGIDVAYQAWIAARNHEALLAGIALSATHVCLPLIVISANWQTAYRKTSARSTRLTPITPSSSVPHVMEVVGGGREQLCATAAVMGDTYRPPADANRSS